MKNSKKTGKFNFIDVIIIVVIALVAAFVAYIFMGDELMDLLGIFTKESDYTYVRYTVSVSSMEDRYVGYLKKEADVMRGDEVIGVIEDIKVSEVERIELNERTDELVVVPYPDHKKVDLVLVAKAEIDNDILNAGDIKIGVGSYVEFKSGGFKTYGYITEFETLDYEPELVKLSEEKRKNKSGAGETVKGSAAN